MLKNALLAGLLLAADLASKAAAEIYLKGKGAVGIIDSVLVLIYAENRGAFLSLGANLDGLVWHLLFIVVPVLFVAGLIIYMAKTGGSSRLEKIAFLLIIAGGAGNLVDRIARNGLVRDFINAGIGPFRTGILNIADLYVTAAVILLAVSFLRAKLGLRAG
jgi:signal peptidase II